MHRLPLLSLFALLALLAGCGGGDGTAPAAPAPSLADNSANRKQVVLLYPSEKDGLLAPFASAVEISETPQQEMTGLLRAYLSTVPGGNMVNPFPERTSLRAFYLEENGRAVVDLDQWAFEGGGTDTETYRIYGMINTICYNYPEIRSVKVLVDGQERETLLGHIDLLNYIPPEPSLNGKLQ